MNRVCVALGNDHQGCASVEDGGASLESEILTLDRSCEWSLPETLLVDVVDGDKSIGIEFGLVKTSKRDFAIIETVGNTRDLVRRNSLADQSLFRQSFDRSKNALVGKGRLG